MGKFILTRRVRPRSAIRSLLNRVNSRSRYLKIIASELQRRRDIIIIELMAMKKNSPDRRRGGYINFTSETVFLQQVFTDLVVNGCNDVFFFHA